MAREAATYMPASGSDAMTKTLGGWSGAGPGAASTP